MIFLSADVIVTLIGEGLSEKCSWLKGNGDITSRSSVVAAVTGKTEQQEAFH